ncbi:hypothetical protein [Staphylococcus phage SpP]
MTEKEWQSHFPKHRIHAFVVDLRGGLYLSDDNKGVPYTHARVFRTKEKAYNFANKYKGQVEIIDLTYSMVGVYQREPLQGYPKVEEN